MNWKDKVVCRILLIIAEYLSDDPKLKADVHALSSTYLRARAQGGTIMSDMTLFGIESTLQSLIQEREFAEAEGDSEVVTAIDTAIGEYLSRETAKVDSYAGLLRHKEYRATACEREIERLQHVAKQERADMQRLKANALRVMQNFGVRVIEGEKAKLTVCRNGGKQPLEITDITVGYREIPAQYQRITVTIPALVWIDLLGLAEAAAPNSATYHNLLKLTEAANREPDTEAIRAALAQRVVCPECKETGVIKFGPDQTTDEKCSRCEGKGTVAATVPGAKLLPRGVHLRVS